MEERSEEAKTKKRICRDIETQAIKYATKETLSRQDTETPKRQEKKPRLHKESTTQKKERCGEKEAAYDPLANKKKGVVVYLKRRQTSKYRNDDRLNIEADKQTPNTEKQKEKQEKKTPGALAGFSLSLKGWWWLVQCASRVFKPFRKKSCYYTGRSCGHRRDRSCKWKTMESSTQFYLSIGWPLFIC